MERISPNILPIILKPDAHVEEVEKKFKIPIKLDQKLRVLFN